MCYFVYYSISFFCYNCEKGGGKMLRSADDIVRLIEEDQWMMNIIWTVKELGLPDCWICAGFIRSKVWDTLHGFSKRTDLADIDVIYFDSSNIQEKQEKVYENQLLEVDSTIPWSVKNQARMHVLNNFPPYTSATDGIAHFPETATSIGVRLDKQGKLEITAPHGISDLLNMKVCPTPAFMNSDIYMKRVNKKNWPKFWTKVRITHQNW